MPQMNGTDDAGCLSRRNEGRAGTNFSQEGCYSDEPEILLLRATSTQHVQ